MRSRDYGDLEGLDCSCLGCLIEARDSGAIDDDILHELATAPTDYYVTCPVCGAQAYLSMWSEVAHCSACGWYSVQDNGDWIPFRQGFTEERYRQWAKERQAASTPQLVRADDTKVEGS